MVAFPRETTPDRTIDRPEAVLLEEYGISESNVAADFPTYFEDAI